MSKIFSLKTRIIGQFLLIVSPFAIALIYQTYKEGERAERLAQVAKIQVLSGTIKQNYAVFVNGVVDAVDSGSVSAKAVDVLKVTKSQLTELFREDAKATTGQALKQIEAMLEAVERSREIRALLPLRGSINELAAQIGRIDQEYSDAIKRSIPSTVERAAQQKHVVILVVILTLFMTILFVWLMVKNLTQPLRTAEAIAQQIASGRIEPHIEVSRSNELGHLLGSLVTMNGSLFNVVKSVKAAAASVAESIDAITAGNEAFTGRARQHAAFLKDAAASMKDLANSVEQNLGSVKQSDVLAARASTVVSTGDEAMSELVRSMALIKENSAKIKETVGLIDDITRQTHLLAHNATIEAARAGVAGGPFAVVAEQMRDLADRVAIAAKDIKNLSGYSVASSEEGSRQVDRVGATMQEIAVAIQRVNEITTRISDASEAQRGGIAHVKRAIETMETIRQDNEIDMKRFTAASEELRYQEHHLANAVAVFDLGEDS